MSEPSTAIVKELRRPKDMARNYLGGVTSCESRKEDVWPSVLVGLCLPSVSFVTPYLELDLLSTLHI